MALSTGHNLTSAQVCRKLRVAFVALALLTTAAPPVSAHHPGENLDAMMGNREKFFQAIDRAAPDFTLRNADGQIVKFSDFRNRVVVLNFVYTSCPDVCPLHAETIAEIQGMINGTPMRDLVQFITVTTDPGNDTAEVLKTYGPTHGLDPSNWLFLTIGPSQSDDETRTLAQAYGHKFVKTDSGYQTHGVVTHIIDRGGRWAANFHGLRFAPVNMVLYINSLTNDSRNLEEANDGSIWGRIKRFFQ